MDKKPLRVIITAGGGGHFSPALSVIQALPKDIEILLIGRKYGFEGEKTISFEYKTAKKLRIPFYALTTGRLQRAWTRHSLVSLLKIPIGVSQAIRIVLQFKPDVVLSFGGYVSLPVVFAAAVLNIPIIIHEQTLGAGLANKIAARFATRICVSWEESIKFFPKGKVVVTGNPLRAELLHESNEKSWLVEKIEMSGKPVAYITGGSLGSHAINELVAGSLKNFLKECAVIHQTGETAQYKDFERLTEFRETLEPELKERYVLTKFIDAKEVPVILKRADLVIGRAGMNTVTELLLFGKPSLLIPLPSAQGNEQRKNALFLKDQGLGEILEQEKATPKVFYELVIYMLSNRKEYLKNAEKSKNIVPKDAAQQIITLLQKVRG